MTVEGDIVASTKAAYGFLSKLYERYGDWLIAITPIMLVLLE